MLPVKERVGLCRWHTCWSQVYSTSAKPYQHCTSLSDLLGTQADQRAAREEAIRIADQKRARLQQVEQERKQQTALLRKRTRTGQPVMKHCIDKLLAQLQGPT